MDQPRTARPAAVQHQAHQVTVTNNGQELGRQLDTIIKPTTVEDLARKGGPIKAVKERDLRELINRSLLTLLESSTSISGAEQERILDKVQAELRKSMGAHATEKAEQQRTLAENQALNNRLLQLESEHAERAGEVGDLRAQLSDAEQQLAGLRAELELQRSTAAAPTDPDRWAKAIDDQWFAGRHRRDADRRGTDQGETLADALAAHLAGCAQLLTDYPSTPPGSDPAGDVVARIKTLLALRLQDQTWIAELQKRQVALMGERDGLRAERDEARGALDAELQRSIEAEERADALEARLAEQPPQQMLSAPPAALEDELADLRDRVQESQSRLDDALAARTRAERELAGAATGRAAAEARLGDADTRLAEAVERVRVLEGQLGDQRRTTDLARLASVEAETLRTEVEGLKRLLHEREQILAQEREKSHADREKHRADNSTRLEAMRRVEQALVALREQLSTAERQLVERTAEVEALRASTPQVRTEIVTIDRAVEVSEMAGQLAAARAALSAAAAERADADRARRVAEAETAALRAHQASAAHLAQERDLLRRALADAEARAEALAARPAPKPVALAAPAAPVAPVVADPGAEARLDELRAVLARAELNRSDADSARRLAEAELAALRAHQADAVALTRERDWLREALLARTAAPTPAAPVPAPSAPAVVVAAVPAPVAAAPAAPAVAAPAAIAPASSTPAKPAPAVEPVRRAGIACLGEDGRVRFAYVRGTTPRLVVHGATWHHQGLAVSSAASGAVPVLLVAGSGVTALYRDRNGAIQRAGIEGRDVVLGDGSADGEPAVLPDPANGRWLLATRRGNRVAVHAIGADGLRALGDVAAAGDPAWIAGNKHAPARLAVPNGGGVSLHGCGEGLPQSGTLPFAAPVAALAVAGIGNDAVIAVRDDAGVVSARTGRRDGTWSDATVLDASGAPAVGRIAAAAHDGEIVVAYRASDGLLQLMLHRGAWRHLAFGENFRAPAAAGDPALVLHDNLIRCFYQGGDGHVHEVRNSSAGWNAYDLSVLTRDL